MAAPIDGVICRQERYFGGAKYVPSAGHKANSVSNLNKKNIGLLRAFTKGKAPGNFVEVMACEGGCISGPCAKVDYSQAQKIFKKAMETI
jgi:iron only hydrogenase large subunit-like protein